MVNVAVDAVVREWHAEEGWGVIDATQTAGGCWARFAHIAVDGYGEFTVGQAVMVEWESGENEGYANGAARVALRHGPRRPPRRSRRRGFRQRAELALRRARLTAATARSCRRVRAPGEWPGPSRSTTSPAGAAPPERGGGSLNEERLRENLDDDPDQADVVTSLGLSIRTSGLPGCDPLGA
jgi:CspA family cold shock protein